MEPTLASEMKELTLGVLRKAARDALPKDVVDVILTEVREAALRGQFNVGISPRILGLEPDVLWSKLNAWLKLEKFDAYWGGYPSENVMINWSANRP